MKFKRLSLEQLKELEPEFINFLASNQITADEWIKIKNSQEQKMNDLINLFSDLVYEKVLNKINYLEHRLEKSLRLFYFEDQQVNLLEIKLDSNSPDNFLNDDLKHIFQNTRSNNASVLHSSKQYQKERALEIFELLESGCVICDDKLYRAIMATRKPNS